MPTLKQAITGPADRPPRYKTALLTWPGAWGLITLILWVMPTSMATWPLALRTLAISVVMVVGLTWFVIPALTRIFASWLAPAPAAPRTEHRDHARHRHPARLVDVTR
jgi:antibiotic biosynthesis monooxygenase (ABM) superfamily enzyme